MNLTFNLFTNYYLDRQPNRQYELEYCLVQNLKCSEIDRLFIVMNPKHQMHFVQMLLRNNIEHLNKKVKVIHYEKRPSYRTWFTLTNKYSSDNTLSCIANTDIFFDSENVSLIKNFDFTGNKCLALSRWDIHSDDKTNAKHYERSDSQDCWIVKSGFKDIKEAYFTLGIAGCDNRIAYLLNENGYNVINPSKTIKSYHYHSSNVRNYINHSNVERLEPPYLQIKPTV